MERRPQPTDNPTKGENTVSQLSLRRGTIRPDEIKASVQGEQVTIRTADFAWVGTLREWRELGQAAADAILAAVEHNEMLAGTLPRGAK